MTSPHFAAPEEPDLPQPPVETGLPERPRASGGLHIVATVICVLMLIFDGFMAMGIINTAMDLLQFKADPRAMLNAMPPGYPHPTLAWLQQYAFPLLGCLLVGEIGSLLLVFGVVGFLRRKRWCVHPLILGFGIAFVILLVLSFTMGPMLWPLMAVTGQQMSPSEYHVGLAMLITILWILFILFRGIPALILRLSAGARWEEEFS